MTRTAHTATLVQGYTIRDLAAVRVAADRRRCALETGALDPLDLEDIDRALGSIENPNDMESMPVDDAIELIRSIIQDYRPAN